MTQPFITIAVHNGIFHDDDVLAASILTTIFKNHFVERTRDQTIIDEADFVIDVGGVYEHERRRYDHHMRYPPTDDSGHKYSSAGLIWKHYAEAYFSAINLPKFTGNDGTGVNIWDEVNKSILNKWIKPIDLIDNGEIRGLTVISELVRSMRPLSVEKTSNNCDTQFDETVEIVSVILERACFHIAESVIAEYKFTESESIFDSSGEILICEVPVYSIDKFCDSDIHFVIYPSKEFIDDENDRYLINPISIAPNRHFKTPIPSELLGLRQEDIERITGCKDVFYIHHTGFVIMSHSLKGAINFCEYILGQKS